MASPSSVMRVPFPLTPPVFESSVLASRFISCSKKSSFLPALAAGQEQLAKMLDVRGHARQLLRDVAALHQHSHLLQHSLLVELRTHGRGQPLRKALLVALLDLGTKLRHAFEWPPRAGRACRAEWPRGPRLRGRASPSTARAAEPSAPSRWLRARPGRRPPRSSACKCAGQAQRGIQVRLALQTVFAPRRIEGREITGNQLAIVSGLRLRGTI